MIDSLNMGDYCCIATIKYVTTTNEYSLDVSKWPRSTLAATFKDYHIMKRMPIFGVTLVSREGQASDLNV